MPSEPLTPTVYNVTTPAANTPISQALPANCKYFTIQARTDVAIRWAFVSGKVDAPTAPYLTLKAGQAYNSPEKLCLSSSGLTLYFAEGTGGVVIEIIAWSAP